jgi:hypothetical protein
MTPQEIFTKSVTAMVAQGRPCLDREGNCVYAGPRGSACAVGSLVDREIALKWTKLGIMPIFELVEILGERKRGKEKILPSWIEDNQDLLERLQSAHDAADPAAHFVEDFVREARNIARAFNLEMPELDILNV